MIEYMKCRKKALRGDVDHWEVHAMVTTHFFHFASNTEHFIYVFNIIELKLAILA